MNEKKAKYRLRAFKILVAGLFILSLICLFGLYYFGSISSVEIYAGATALVLGSALIMAAWLVGDETSALIVAYAFILFGSVFGVSFLAVPGGWVGVMPSVAVVAVGIVMVFGNWVWATYFATKPKENYI